MHELFTQVLSNRDLSRAGDLFSIPDSGIVNDLTEVLKEITTIASLPDYAHNDNDQSVVEICLTRITSCIRETGTVEQHCDALVALLESCLHHNLQPSARDEDPPHAKISADIISCLFLNYGKRSVMQHALPVAVKFLHKGNKELSRNMASYLSLAAIEHANLLSPHVQPIMDSIISGNYPLCRVLAQIYEVSKEPIQGHAMALVTLLPRCNDQEKLALLNLFSLFAKNKPTLLEASVPQLCEYLNNSVTVSATMKVLLNLAERRPTLLAEHVLVIKKAAQKHPHSVCSAAQILTAVGKLNKERAQDALNFVLEQLPKVERGSQNTLLREATLLCSSYPILFTDKVLAGVRLRHHSSSNQVNQTSGGVTIVKVGGTQSASSQTPSSMHITPIAHQPVQQPLTVLPLGSQNSMQIGVPPINCTHTSITHAGNQPVQQTQVVQSGGYARRAKLGDSRSTGRLHTATTANTHRSMTRLNIAGGSVGGLHKSMTRLSSSQQINSIISSSVPPHQQPQNIPVVPTASGNITVSGNKWTVSPSIGPTRVTSGGVTVTTISPKGLRPLSQGPLTMGSVTISGPSALSTSPPINSGAITVNPVTMSSSPITVGGPVSVSHTSPIGPGPVSISGPTTVTSRRNHNNTTVTILNTNNQGPAAQRMSVFEPYPMRDTVQHFCEKHLDKIKAYMDKVSVRIPPPAKCTIEERRAKKLAKLHFACQARGQHCLYSRTFFTMRTRNPRVWIHLMFIALQARSPHALSSRDPSVSSLKHCWDMLKCENKTFLTLVTSAFPCAKDQEALLNELRHSGFFDVFQLGPSTVGGSADPLSGTNLQWGCFLCTHPERAVGFLRGNTQPVIEGQLKEKKGRWRLFRRWRTRYFTLSGAHLSVKGSSGGESIDVNQIRSVKVSRGARNIPKAFEIFTGDQSLILKPKDGKNAEEWVQCLSIVVAHSHARELPAKSNSLPARGIGNSRGAL